MRLARDWVCETYGWELDRPDVVFVVVGVHLVDAVVEGGAQGGIGGGCQRSDGTHSLGEAVGDAVMLNYT
jgi:hypothetical protein